MITGNSSVAMYWIEAIVAIYKGETMPSVDWRQIHDSKKQGNQ